MGSRVPISTIVAAVGVASGSVFLLWLAGCSPVKSYTAALTAMQATDLALRLANEKAQDLFHRRPYSDGPLAQLVEGSWIWHDRRGQGQVDFEATVKFGTNGAAPSVSVMLLDNRVRPERGF